MPSVKKLKNYKNFRLAQSDFLKLSIEHPIIKWVQVESTDEIELTITFNTLESIDDIEEY